jgi:MYXO-CTERM domain-containing protein
VKKTVTGICSAGSLDDAPPWTVKSLPASRTRSKPAKSPTPGGVARKTDRVIATVTFPDTIIGVIADEPELLASDFLGDASANYLNPSQRGLEANQDSFSISGSDLMVDFSASTPGDSIRVILGSASPSLSYNICDPQYTTLTGSVTGGSAATAGGQFSELCMPIGSIGNDNLQSNDLFAFRETQYVFLSQPLTIDEPTPTTIPAGTPVTSYYVAFDPSNSKDVVGSVTFPNPILGVMTSTSSLTDSDLLGNSTATYLNPGLRGLEPGVDSVSVAGSTLSVDFSAESPGDYVRVVVVGTPPTVPAVGIVALTGTLSALGALALRRRRRPAD